MHASHLPIPMPQRQKNTIQTTCRPAAGQRGVALFVVLVFILLSMLLALWASRTALFNEIVVGNDADYQRTFEAAQALMLDAEFDIRGQKSNGDPCTPNDDVCRGSGAPQIPLESQDVMPLIAGLAEKNKDTRCDKGLCTKRLGAQDFWNKPENTDGIGLAELQKENIGARYGQFTGAVATDNPILQETDEEKGAWYWVEVLPYNASSEFSNVVHSSASVGNSLLPLSVSPAVVYRITAIAHGLKPGSTTVLQETYARTVLKD